MSESLSEPERLTTKDMLDMVSTLGARWAKRYTAGALARTLAIDTISRAIFAGLPKAEVEAAIAELEKSLREMTKTQRAAARVTNAFRRVDTLLKKIEQREKKLERRK